jgi:hypothetical protein
MKYLEKFYHNRRENYNPDEWKASRKSIWRLKQSIIPNDLLGDNANRIILPRKK